MLSVGRGSLLTTFVACAALSFNVIAQAANVSTNNLLGNFSATMSGSGTASMTASGTFSQWWGGSPYPLVQQVVGSGTRGLSIPAVSHNSNASGNANFDYAPLTPGTVGQVNSLNANFTNGSSVPVQFAVDPFTLHIMNLGNFNLALTFNGSLSDIVFSSTGASDPGASYKIPGLLSATLAGNLTGQLVNVPAAGNVNLGTIYSLNESVELPIDLPGDLDLSDLTSNAGPFPADMLALFNASALEFDIPLSMPIDVQISNNISHNQHGISSLNIQGSINATLALDNMEYNLSETVPVALVPEPSTFVLAGIGALSLLTIRWHRRRRFLGQAPSRF